ncbi:MAG TPA: MarR family winged helix-turn-helix transcriptional regulator [Candidatus Dormibacteraeota bacterium]
MDRIYRDLWAELHRGDTEDLGQHELDLLSHLPPDRGVTLQWLADHLLLPKSTTSVLVKDLDRRGFLSRQRRADNQREVSITLTKNGARRVAESTVLDTTALARSFEGLPPTEVSAALDTLERVVAGHRQSKYLDKLKARAER